MSQPTPMRLRGRMSTWSWLRLLSTAIAVACARAPQGARAPVAPAPAVERLVLDRGACFGHCPVYTMTVTRAGALDVVTAAGTTHARIAPAAAQRLLAQAVTAGVLTVPAQIAADPALCPVRATDHATVRLTVATPTGVRMVEHYTGCYVDSALALAPAVAQLVALEAVLDTVARDSTARTGLR